MISDYEKGGLRMIDVRIFARALKSTWIKKYLDTHNAAKWTYNCEISVVLLFLEVAWIRRVCSRDMPLKYPVPS